MLTTGRARARVAHLSPPLRRPGAAHRLASARARHERQRRFDAGEVPASCPRPPRIAGSALDRGPGPADLDDRRVEITGPAEPKMMINALNSGARVFMADFEDALSPPWANVVGGAGELHGRRAAHPRVHQPRGQARTGWAIGWPRWWSARAAGTSRSGTSGSTAGRCRPACSTSASTSTTTPASCSRRGQRSLLLPAQAREPSRGTALERRCSRRRRTRSAHAPGDDPRHGADRDHRGRVRDGRDPVRAAPPRGRAQRRPLGLHLQRDQEIRARGRSSCCPTGRRSRWACRSCGRTSSSWCGPATAAGRTPSAAWRRSSRRAGTRR